MYTATITRSGNCFTPSHVMNIFHRFTCTRFFFLLYFFFVDEVRSRVIYFYRPQVLAPRMIGSFAGGSRARGFVILILMCPTPPGCNNFCFIQLRLLAQYNGLIPVTLLDIGHASISAKLLQLQRLFSAAICLLSL